MADHPTLTDAEREALRDPLAAAILGRTATDAAARVVPIVERILAARTVPPASAQPDGLADRVRALHKPWYEIGGVRHDHRVLVGDPPADHVCVLPVPGVAEPCEDGDHSVLACAECRFATDDAEPGYALWPCPTIRLLDDAAVDPIAPARTLMPDPDDLPVGTPVLAWPGSRDFSALVTVTRSLPWRLPAGDVVVQVEGIAGGVALTHVEVLPLALLADAGEREGDGRG